jgi:hypothetical protein
MIFKPDENIAMFFGINTGFFILGILFYIIGLAGPLLSVRSLLYLFTVTSFWGTVFFGYLLNGCTTNSCQLKYHIVTMIIGNGGVGYFAILIMNTVSILDRKWIYTLCFIALPAILAIEAWYIFHVIELAGIKTRVNLHTLNLVCMILTSVNDSIVNIICLWRFSKYKHIVGLKNVLKQYVSGVIFSLLADVALVIVHIVLDLHALIAAQFVVISLFINLNIEYFLLYQLRIVILGEIQFCNSAIYD